MKSCSSPCGVGKTYRFVERAIHLAERGKTVIFAQPTKELIRRTIETELEKQWPEARYQELHGDTVGAGKVVAALIQRLKQRDDRGEIIFTTHSVLQYLPFVPPGLHLLIDESPQVFAYESLLVPQNHPLITDLTRVEAHNETYSGLVPRDAEAKDRLKEIAANRLGDEIYERVRDLAGRLSNNHWDSFVGSKQYHNLISGKAQKLTVFSVLHPTVITGFDSVLMAAANLEQSLAYRLWRLKGIKITRDQELQAKLLFQQHQNGRLITIKYYDDWSWSRKRQGARLHPDDPADLRTVLDQMISAIRAEFVDQQFLWQGNLRLNNPFGLNACRLPNAPHGLNSYSHIHNFAFLSALNPSSDQFRFLEFMGLSGQEVREAIYFETAYQSGMRTSIRDPDNTSPKTIIVPDRELAEFLGRQFPGATITKVDIGLPSQGVRKQVGRHRIHASDKDRKAAFRSKKKLAMLEDLFGLQRTYGQAGGGGDETGIRIITHFVPDPLTYSLYNTKRTKNCSGYLKSATLEDSVNWLKAQHSRSWSKKDKNGLISPAIFNPDHPDRLEDQGRGLGNICEVTQVWMDFENGDLKPETFAELFPDYRMVLTNTYNHTENKPRYRVILPLTQPVTPEVHGLIYDDLIHRLEASGYSVGKVDNKATNTRKSGLDTSKIAPTSLFYAPCQTAVEGHSFFHDYHGAERQVLNPIDIVNNGVWRSAWADDLAQTETRASDSINEASVEEATEEWRQAKNYPGEGNRRFFRYAMRLVWAGMNLSQIEEVLRSEAAHGRSPKERRQQIPSVMMTLRKFGQ